MSRLLRAPQGPERSNPVGDGLSRIHNLPHPQVKKARFGSQRKGPLSIQFLMRVLDHVFSPLPAPTSDRFSEIPIQGLFEILGERLEEIPADIERNGDGCASMGEASWELEYGAPERGRIENTSMPPTCANR
jgi:hypothetical protein